MHGPMITNPKGVYITHVTHLRISCIMVKKYWAQNVICLIVRFLKAWSNHMESPYGDNFTWLDVQT